AEPYDFTGTYTATCLSTDLEVLNDDLGYGYPTEFEVVISDYNESTGKYYIYTFLNENTNSINYGGIPMVASDDNSDVQVVTTDKYIKTIEAGTYMKLRDVDGGSNTINLTANEDGTLTLDDFSVVIYDFDAGEYIAAIYHNVTLTKASDAVKSISAPAKNEAKVYAAAGTIYVIGGEPTYVEVYNAAGVQVYAGIASEVSGLARGIYYVRAGQTVTPVIL
ncbi:MAG: hypothetical protein LUI04_01900, partial [Porphyromonadaceae bacterium]|nr:hypothetical protein [Porphyromonadaceae bacterium]